ncbi:META domain-containing protein [Mycobacteroides stephanolepidis]|uniref:META domain-containing protein n=1 Tax=[Mycobacterium] stephanolepidis TaxID=1520670 RepID=UPI0038CD7EC8
MAVGVCAVALVCIQLIAAQPIHVAASHPLQNLVGKRWVLVSYSLEKLLMPYSGEEAYLQFDHINDSTNSTLNVTGTNGCNRVMGAVVRQAQHLAFAPVGSTRRLCPWDSAEQQFLEALDGNRDFWIGGDRLTIMAPDSRRLWIFQSPS